MKRVSRMFPRLFILCLVVCLVSLVFAAPVFANSGGDQTTIMQPLDVNSFLQWLIGGGGSILAVSWILERLKWFQELTSDQRDYAIFGSSVIVGCGALAVVTYVPVVILTAIAPYFLIIASVFTTVFIAKAFHSADKLTGK
jgi:hypothetical protein